KGKRQSASAEIVAKLAEALGTNVEYFMTEPDSEKLPPPEHVKRLAELVGGMSPTRQEELLKIAALLDELDRQRNAMQEAQEIEKILQSIGRELGEAARKEYEQVVLNMGIIDRTT